MTGAPTRSNDKETGMAEETKVRLFSEWVATQRRGELDLELTAALAEVTSGVHDLGKGGSVTLKISVKPGGGRGRTVLVTDDVTAKAPEADRESAVFFVDGAGNLRRDDPYNEAMFDRDGEVPG
jgi:hypothetical protein